MIFLSQMVSVRAVYWLQHFLSYFDVSICIVLDVQQMVRGTRGAYLQDAKLVGNNRKLQHEAIIFDQEYADDMASVIELSWDDTSQC